MINQISEMEKSIANADDIYKPSLFWQAINRKHIEQLEIQGFDNFKRTLNQQYFNFFITSHKSGFFKNVFLRWLKRPKLSVFFSRWEGDSWTEAEEGKLKPSKRQAFFYKTFVTMLYEYVKSIDVDNITDFFEEPGIGNSLKIRYQGKLISQDQCNSILEYYSITKYFRPAPEIKINIAELGGGYGRTAHLLLSKFNCRYVLFDIPPALYVAEEYLTRLFPNKKIFKFRNFKNFQEIKKEFESADIAFFTPNQIELLPKPQFDLFINISSLQEMKKTQIRHYFNLIDEYCRGYFYSKQWLINHNKDDNEIITHKDYPNLNNFKLIEFKTNEIYTDFFEAIYKKTEIV